MDLSRLEKRKKKREKFLKLKRLSCIFVWILIFIVTPICLAFSFINSTFYVSVSSNSMAPTIKQGDKILVSKTKNNYNHRINRNDVIIFYSEEIGSILIKRVVGIPGDEICFDSDFNLKVNDEYIVKNSNVNLNFEYKYDVPKQNEKIIVPDEAYFVIGDNISNSFDSRFWEDKFVSRDLILGKAVVLFNPLNRFFIF